MRVSSTCLFILLAALRNGGGPNRNELKAGVAPSGSGSHSRQRQQRSDGDDARRGSPPIADGTFDPAKDEYDSKTGSPLKELFSRHAEDQVFQADRQVAFRYRLPVGAPGTSTTRRSTKTK